MPRRAIGIVRVSQVGGREGSSFASPETQLERIRAEAVRGGLELVAVHEELDVSGGANLQDRPGLRPAVEAIEAGEAEVLIAAYFDRFFRGLSVQAQVIARVEQAGGQVLAVDFGVVSHGTAAQWLSASVTGMMAEYYRRTAAERNAENIQRAIFRGVPPWPRVTVGYLKREDKRYEPDPVLAPVVSAGFDRRADGWTVREFRESLLSAGARITYPGAVKLLASRVVLGEIHFGQFEPNLEAHEPIVDRPVWEAVQAVVVPKGRKGKSHRLLARLGVLRCGTCDSRMVAGSTTSRGYPRAYPIYRCNAVDCPRKVTIGARLVEEQAMQLVLDWQGGKEGQASMEVKALAAEKIAAESQKALSTLIRVLDVVGGEREAMERLRVARERRDADEAVAERLRRASRAGRSRLGSDEPSFEEWRGLILGNFERITVAPGRGENRLDFTPLG